MAEENKEVERTQKMDKDTEDFLTGLCTTLCETFNAVNKVLEKKSCNRAEAALIKAHGVILKSKLTQLHGAKIAD